MAVAMKYVNNEHDAAHSVNDSFIKICNKIDTYNEEYSFITWSRTIVTRTVIDELRKNKKYKDSIWITDDLENLDREEDDQDEYIIIDKNEIVAAMDKLPNATKNVVKMFFLDGYNHQDISDILNISTETSKWHLKTGKKKLKELLPDYIKR
jgi:RNA polymerase sigma factor (sigma-70 family)